jgi:hypothetical protein
MSQEDEVLVERAFRSKLVFLWAQCFACNFPNRFDRCCRNGGNFWIHCDYCQDYVQLLDLNVKTQVFPFAHEPYPPLPPGYPNDLD